MKDFLGKEIATDDILIIRMPEYAGLCLARVLAFTPKKVRIEYFNVWNYSGTPHRQTRLIDPFMVAKVDDNAAEAHRAKYGHLFTDVID